MVTAILAIAFALYIAVDAFFDRKTEHRISVLEGVVVGLIIENDGIDFLDNDDDYED